MHCAVHLEHRLGSRRYQRHQNFFTIILSWFGLSYCTEWKSFKRCNAVLSCANSELCRSADYGLATALPEQIAFPILKPSDFLLLELPVLCNAVMERAVLLPGAVGQVGTLHCRIFTSPQSFSLGLLWLFLYLVISTTQNLTEVCSLLCQQYTKAITNEITYLGLQALSQMGYLPQNEHFKESSLAVITTRHLQNKWGKCNWKCQVSSCPLCEFLTQVTSCLLAIKAGVTNLGKKPFLFHTYHGMHDPVWPMIATMIVSSCYILIFNAFSCLSADGVLTKDSLTFCFSCCRDTHLHFPFVVVLVTSDKSFPELKMFTLLHGAI